MSQSLIRKMSWLLLFWLFWKWNISCVAIIMSRSSGCWSFQWFNMLTWANYSQQCGTQKPGHKNQGDRCSQTTRPWPTAGLVCQGHKTQGKYKWIPWKEGCLSFKDHQISWKDNKMNWKQVEVKLEPKCKLTSGQTNDIEQSSNILLVVFSS